MGVYFRKRAKILPGIRLNISKTGTSWTIGSRGASVNIGKKGIFVNAGIPGTGIYSRTKIPEKKKANRINAKMEKDSEIINKNPLRFALVMSFFSLSVIIPLLSDASWIWFPILAFIGICCAFIPDNNNDKQEKAETLTINQNIIESCHNSALSSKAGNEKGSEMQNTISKPKGDFFYSIDKTKLDPLFEDAARLVIAKQQGSTSLIQRTFSTGYARAEKIMEQLECAQIVGGASGSKAREVLCIDDDELASKLSVLTERQFEILEDKYKKEIEELQLQSEYDKSSRLIHAGIDLEKEKMINEAIAVYEKVIVSRLPIKHPYERLAILYRKRKDYENEIRVLKIAIDVFMKENEKRAGRVTDENNSMYKEVMTALESNESIQYEDGKWAFVQYDVMEYITRLDKANKLLEKQKQNNNKS